MRRTNKIPPAAGVGTTVVVFTLREKQLNLLLTRRSRARSGTGWALPGGPLDLGEDLEQSARRRLEEETGVAGVYLEQLYTFSNRARTPGAWGVTVAHYALIPLQRATVEPGGEARSCAWFALDRLPELSENHAHIVMLASRRLATKLEYSTIAFQFLPERFTLPELQDVYEIILQQALDKRNFRKALLAKDYIEETGATKRNGPHRPAKLYRVKVPGHVQYSN